MSDESLSCNSRGGFGVLESDVRRHPADMDFVSESPVRALRSRAPSSSPLAR